MLREDLAIWKDVVGYEGIYQVSNFGQVRSLERIDLAKKKRKSKYLKQCLDPHYFITPLSDKNKKRKLWKVHRLVAMAFIEKPIGKDFVNHKNGIKTDNRVDNLEWVTKGENAKHSYRELGRIGAMAGRFGKNSPMSKKIYCPTLSIYFGGCKEAARQLGIFATSISRVCLGKQVSTHGLTFRYL